MKKITIFIVLKILEIGGVLGVSFGAGILHNKYLCNLPFMLHSYYGGEMPNVFFAGFYTILVGALVLFLFVILCFLVLLNWDWAKKITSLLSR